MNLTFTNGYEISIMHPDFNTYLTTGEVGYWRMDDEEPMKIAYFVDANDLHEVLDMISKL